MNIGKLFTRHARYRPNHPAIFFQDKQLTYRELDRSVNRLANALVRLGIGKGDKIATVLPNSLELYEAFWAVAKIGAVIVPMSTLLMEGALKSLLNDSDAVALITDTQFAEFIAGIQSDLPNIPSNRYVVTGKSNVPGFQNYHDLKAAAADTEPQGITVLPDDPFNIMYSSGTTGLPQGIVHTHAIRLAYGTVGIAAYRMTPESVTMHAVPSSSTAHLSI